jgi:hypothetical protein
MLNMSQSVEKNRKFSDEECKVLLSNMLWFDFSTLNTFITYFCQKTKHFLSDVVQTILNSSLKSEELFSGGAKFSQRTVLSRNGPCYTFNGLSFSELFNTEIIHDDFKSFEKFLKGTNIEDNSTWSPDKGLDISDGSDLKSLNSLRTDITLKLSPENTRNLLGTANYFRLFIHKPNEIVTEMHENWAMNYNEVRIELILFKCTARFKSSYIDYIILENATPLLSYLILY